MIKRNTKTNKLVPWRTMLLEKLVFPQLVEKLYAFHGN